MMPSMPPSDSHNPLPVSDDARYELVRCSRELVQRLIDDDSDPVVVVRLQRMDDGTCEMWLRTPGIVGEVKRLREALTLVQKLVNIPSEQILDDTERARRIKLVVDTCLAAREALEAGER